MTPFAAEVEMKSLFLCLFLGAFSLNAFAFVIRPGKLKFEEISNKSGLNFYLIKMDGSIAHPMAAEFNDLRKKMTDPKRLLLIDLNSNGGVYSEGMKIIAQIRQEKMNGRAVFSTVENGAICGSMCVPIYIQGSKRFAGEVSAFMFHGAVRAGITNIPDEGKTNDLINVILDGGASPEWIQLMRSREAFSLPGQYWISGKELMDEKSSIPTDLISRHKIEEPRESPMDPQIRPR